MVGHASRAPQRGVVTGPRGAESRCRRARDPIEHVRTLLLEHDFAEPAELKKIEKELKQVRAAASAACPALVQGVPVRGFWAPAGEGAHVQELPGASCTTAPWNLIWRGWSCR